MRHLTFAAAWVAASCLSSLSLADDDVNPTGTWRWSVNGGREVTLKLKLKLEGDKLTGAVLGGDNQEILVENASYNYKDGEIAFTVTRERDGQKFSRKYKGKVSGDTITGTIEFERDGQKTGSRDWEAKRSKP